ncbi:MAG TPA: hypothetical protein VLM89_02945 [Phycisphaerae bacterium]|nr:hypothetical protein [Phycisphaerae bacterium]
MAKVTSTILKPSGPALAAAVIVARPGDETRWAGGTILTCAKWNWFVLSLCGGDDAERSTRFWRALDYYDALGSMADLDDSPSPEPLDGLDVRKTILAQVPTTDFDVIFTYAPRGPAARDLRCNEVAQAVIDLWRDRELTAHHLMLFADDPPHLLSDTMERLNFTDRVRQTRQRLLTETYGLPPDTARSNPAFREEVHYHFQSPEALAAWLAGARRNS